MCSSGKKQVNKNKEVEDLELIMDRYEKLNEELEDYEWYLKSADLYDWNPVFNLVIKIKKDYINTYKDNETLFENWLKKLNKKEYNEIFECLQINQYNNLILIRYGLAEMQSGMWQDKNSIYRECRSLVIDLKNESIVLCPFKKFFNINEVEENSIENIYQELKNAKVVEITNKLDGSMQNARYYNGEIIMSGSMALDPKNSWRLEDGYKKLSNNHKKMLKDNPMYNFTFEYISIKDAHVVSYNKQQEGLYLVGMRNVYTGEQLTYDELKYYSQKYNIKMTKIEKLSFDEVLDRMKNYKANEKEGWVVNIDGHLIKVKCDDYIKLHKLLDKVSSINVIIQNIADNKYDDMMCKIPESHKHRVEKIANKILEYRNSTNQKINKYYLEAPKENKKIFMVWVDNNCPKEIRGYVKYRYLNKEFNVLKKSNTGYKKLKELNICENYSKLFSDLDI